MQSCLSSALDDREHTSVATVHHSTIRAPKNAVESEGTEEDAMDESFEQWSKRSQVDTDITSSVRSAVEHRESSERRGS